jgi:hypothetical protein
MKLLPLNVVVASSLAIFLPHAASSQDTAPGRLNVPAFTQSGRTTLAAESIVREDPANPGLSPFASLVHLRGNVVVRTCCVQFPPSKESPNPPISYMILRADEADYHGDTGEIEARGAVRVSFQPRQPAQ